MKACQYCLLYGPISLLIAITAINCGGPKGPSSEERVKALEAKGVPDSVLSNLKLYLYNITTKTKTGDMGAAGRYKDSLKTGLVAAEAWYAKTMADDKTFIESTRKSIIDRKAALRGMPLKDCDSALKVADSLVAMNWLLQAKDQFVKIDSMMPVLLANQKKAEEIKPKLIGTWKNVHVALPPDGEEGEHYKALETSIYTFGKDGSFSGIEEKHGQSTHFLKEDWKFLSWGKYDFEGDTVYMLVNREKCALQNYTRLNMKTNKWEKEIKPTYDSTITNSKKDKFVLYEDLKRDFKKSK